VRVRRASPADAHGIASVIAAVAEERRWLSTVPPVDVVARSARIVHGMGSGRMVSFVAIGDDDAIVGELSLFRRPLEVSVGMCLLPAARGHGLGGALLDAALDHAADAGWPLLILYVYEHNDAALRLYASRGFVPVGDRETDDLGEGRIFTAIRMERLASSAARRAVLDTIAGAIVGRPEVRRVAIDGPDGAGKSCFADELGHVLRVAGVPVVRASVDGFHHPRAMRYARGRHSPRGFYEDSYDYAALRDALLDPLGGNGDGRFRRAVHDVATDEPIVAPEEQAPAGAVLLLDGIFLHRPGLRDAWDVSVYLEVDPARAIARGARRDGGDPDPASDANRRYVEGQRIYRERADPRAHASFVIDNNALDAPTIVSSR